MPEQERPGLSWAKYLALLKWIARKRYDWILYLDTDAVVMDNAVRVEDVLTELAFGDAGLGGL